jgi:toxin CcdB
MNTNRTPAMHATDDSQAPKKATNPRANADLLHKAREMDINTDRTRSPQAAAARAMAGGEEADSDRDVQRSRRAAWRVQRRAADLLMTQFAVYRNPNPDTVADYPLLLNVQSDLIAELGTRVVVPLCPAAAMKGKLLDTLTPVFEVEGKQYAMLTPQLAGIPKKAPWHPDRRPRAASRRDHRRTRLADHRDIAVLP